MEQLPDIVEQTYDEVRAALDTLYNYHEPSSYSSVSLHLRKVLILSGASYFESRLQEAVRAFCKQVTHNNPQIISLVDEKAISRQYHSWFDWNAKNANRFLSMFGRYFKDIATSEIANNDELENAVTSFLELGSLRNNLAHRNFATYSLEKTPDEIMATYRQARKFVEYVESLFDRFASGGEAEAAEE